MTSVYVVSRVKSGGGFTADVPDRVYFHEHRARQYCEQMNKTNESGRKAGKAWHELRFAYRKMPVFGRKVVMEDTPEPEVGAIPMETPVSPVVIPPTEDKLAKPKRAYRRKNVEAQPVEPPKEEAPRRRRAMRTNKHETKTEGVAETA